MTPRALVFDCDGTLADSMPAHFVAWGDALRPHGLVFPEERFYAAAGMSTREIIEMLAREQGRRVDVAAIALDKDEQYLRHLEHVRPIEPVVAIAREHRGRIPMAVATGNVRRLAEATLGALGICEWFQAIVGADEVARSKPAPDAFLEAARRLGVDPRECRAYEDGDPGLEAARAAGMEAIDVRPWLG
ncbi:MAG: HAD family phosphatase [Myxococcales bacterium]|nr:HAD family phosphatase [Myxococcales bacterium]MCB9716633.1 HAD family phosphatase [Myxococcales bacterium]